MEPVYSIIIPHYNTPELLVRCLRSIPVRRDVQVIVVDDCSPGATEYTIKYPELSRPFVEFYSTTEGGSAGRARNVGLQHARGRWCMFADADDYYEDGFLDKISRELDDSLEILYFNISGTGHRAQLHQKIFELYLTNHDETEIRYHIWEPWNKVFALQFIFDNQLRFEEVPVGNDAMFCLKASRAARHYHIIEQQLYCLTDNIGSISYRPLSFEREMDYAKVRTRINLFMAEQGLELRYGYRLFSIHRFLRFRREYGWCNSLQYACYISRHYGIFRALYYNLARLKFQNAHPDLIFCD